MSDAVFQTEQEIKKLAHEWLDAARRRDRATLDRILADDFQISGWDGFYRFDRWQVRRYGETGVVNCILEIRAIVEGAAWGGEVLVTDVWAREGSQWQGVTRHTSPIVRGEKASE